MADYKRLVSYMYNYENGIKKNNIGYARVEVRNGQCKVTISIKALSFNNTSLKAYIFKHLGDMNKCYNLGDILIKNGNGEFRLITNSSNIVNSGYSLDDMAGIVVYKSPDKFFATEWDDIPVARFDLDEVWNPGLENNEANNIVLPIKEITNDIEKRSKVNEELRDSEVLPRDAEKVLSIVKEVSSSGAESPSSGAEVSSGGAEVSSGRAEVLRDAEKVVSDIAKAREKISEIDNEPNQMNNYDENKTILNAKLSTGDDIEDNVEALSDSKNKVQNINSNIQELIQNLTSIIDKKSNENKSIQKESANQTNNQNDVQKQYTQLKEEAPKNVETNVATLEKNQNVCLYPIDYTFFDYYEKTSKPESNVSTESVEQKRQNESKESKIFGNYPKLNPFEDNEIIDSIKIEPQDIGIFPMEFWVLGNNSFLLHAYYNYRHLLLAKRKKENSIEYILGVPGIYENKEKFIANMFGFFDFKGTSLRKPKNGDFGYWLLDIKL